MLGRVFNILLLEVLALSLGLLCGTSNVIASGHDDTDASSGFFTKIVGGLCAFVFYKR